MKSDLIREIERVTAGKVRRDATTKEIVAVYVTELIRDGRLQPETNNPESAAAFREWLNDSLPLERKPS
jgi:hypothetical protein